ncbi:Crp/Fnr family transcriptional regulator [Eggerthella timonensis]|uniref:Crp/Fnr family transcriptional regulator n=1 Tax=Eggerthella timonensis TaxID=1871008 RepID=UPI0011AEFF44|nr:Crp/Fnr family transcriptional regulator [Eggerthella timonensis]
MSKSTSKPCTCLNPFCAQIAPEVRTHLCDVCTSVHYGKYKRLYVPTYNPRLFIIKEGLAVQKIVLPNGKQFGLSFDGPGCALGTFFGTPLTDPFPHKSSFSEVLQPVRGGLISVADARSLADRFPVLTNLFLKNMESNLARMIDFSYHLALPDSVDKIVYVLKHLKSQGIGLDELTHEDIASLLNMNRVTVTKTMRAALARLDDGEAGSV